MRDDDEFDDDEPRRRRGRREPIDRRPGLATAAAVLWLVSAGLLFLTFAVRAYLLADAGLDNDFIVCGGIDVLMVLGLCFGVGLAGVLTLYGSFRSLTSVGVLSLLLPVAMLVMETGMAFLTGVELVKDRGPSDIPMRLAGRSCCLNSVLVSGVLLAGIFALSARTDYARWAEWRAGGD